MAVLDEIGERLKCDRCGACMTFDESAYEYCNEVWNQTIYKGCLKNDIYGDFCKPCAKIMTPWVYRMRDIYALRTSVNKLERTIREHRSKNNRPPAHPAG